MPNWCVGTLKVRGDIKRFLTEGLQAQNMGAAFAELLGKPVVEKHAEIEDTEDVFTIKADEGFYVKGTRRNFIENTEIEWYTDEEVLVIDSYKAAWDIDVSGLVKLSESCQVDLKIYAYERGQEFNRNIEIRKGTLIKDEEITFPDYRWDCPHPELGG